jgi:hypothetical protein
MSPSRARRWLKAAAFLVVLFFAAVAAAMLALLPPRAAVSPAADWTPRSPVIKGAFHIHSARSDGTGTLDEIAAAAARAGLQFIVMTDHGDGTRAPGPPIYRSGVLCVDAVEVSTTYGHLVALGVPQMPFRLAGHPRDVIEDVHRAGGFAVAAHPGSPKPALRWEDWQLPFDGLEWLNADSEWRDELWGTLARGLLTYAARPGETLATLIDRPASVLDQWDRLTVQRRVVGIAGADAHARLSVRSGSEPYDDRVLARLPSYEASFRAFVNHVILESPPSGDAVTDAAALLDAIRAGRVFSSVEGLAKLGAFEMTIRSNGRVAAMGAYLDGGSAITLDAQLAAPDGTTMVVLKDGQPVHRVTGNRLAIDLDANPAAYRIEAHLRSETPASVPWLVTNPVYVNLSATHATLSAPRAAKPGTTSPVAREWWRPESSTDSESQIELATARAPVDETSFAWRLRIAGGAPVAQYAAIAFGSNPQFVPYNRVRLRARASRPMRLWAQLRAPGPAGGKRWARSVYIGTEAQTIELAFDEFTPVVLGSEPARAPIDDIESFLFVVDTLNTLPATAATITIEDMQLVKDAQ